MALLYPGNEFIVNIQIRRGLLNACLFLSVLTVGCVKATPPPPPPPPPSAQVIARVTAAKKIFLANAGSSELFTDELTGGANGSYNELYASLKQWGYFQLVDSPAQADLIFKIRSDEDIDETQVMDWNPHSTSSSYTIMGPRHPKFTLSILDPPTGTVLYQIVSPAGRGSNIPKGKIAFTQSINVLTDKIKAIVTAPAPAQNP
jgi:hypothetical protein